MLFLMCKVVEYLEQFHILMIDSNWRTDHQQLRKLSSSQIMASFNMN